MVVGCSLLCIVCCFDIVLFCSSFVGLLAIVRYWFLFVGSSSLLFVVCWFLLFGCGLAFVVCCLLCVDLLLCVLDCCVLSFVFVIWLSFVGLIELFPPPFGFFFFFFCVLTVVCCLLVFVVCRLLILGVLVFRVPCPWCVLRCLMCSLL